MNVVIVRRKGYCPICGHRLDRKLKICRRCGYGVKIQEDINKNQ